MPAEIKPGTAVTMVTGNLEQQDSKYTYKVSHRVQQINSKNSYSITCTFVVFREENFKHIHLKF